MNINIYLLFLYLEHIIFHNNDPEKNLKQCAHNYITTFAFEDSKGAIRSQLIVDKYYTES
jgi:hypothetical protein